MTRPVTLGSGTVTYTPDHPIVHFGSPEGVTYTPAETPPSDDAKTPAIL